MRPRATAAAEATSASASCRRVVNGSTALGSRRTPIELITPTSNLPSSESVALRKDVIRRPHRGSLRGRSGPTRRAVHWEAAGPVPGPLPRSHKWRAACTRSPCPPAARRSGARAISSFSFSGEAAGPSACAVAAAMTRSAGRKMTDVAGWRGVYMRAIPVQKCRNGRRVRRVDRSNGA